MREVSIIGLGEVGLLFAAIMSRGHEIEIRGVDKAPGQRGIVEAGTRSRGRGYVIPNFPVGKDIQPADVHVVCVDTPLDEVTHRADLTNMREACVSISRVLRRGDLVIIRSTVPVGTTRKELEPLLLSENLLDEGEFFLAYAPERSSSGGSLGDTLALPHLVGGRDKGSLEEAGKLLKAAELKVVLMESIEAAELGKLATNAARDIYQALANQISNICSEMNIDARQLVDDINWEYPRNRLNHPSPGVGGSCLTKDPYFLAQSLAGEPSGSIFGVARRINDHAAESTFESLTRFLNRRPDVKHKVLVCGIAFKGNPETWDTRNSTSLIFARRVMALERHDVRAWDPVLDDTALAELDLTGTPDPFRPGAWDAVLIFSNHLSLQSEITARKIVQSVRPHGYIYDPHRAIHADMIPRGTSFTYRGISKEGQIGGVEEERV